MTGLQIPKQIEEQDKEQIRQRVQERVDELLAELSDPPYFQVIQNGGGHIDPMHRFPTEEEAKEYHRMRFGGISDRTGYLAYHRQNWGGLITRSMRQIQRPRVLCIFEERTQRVKYSGLLPSEDYRKDGESAFHNRTVWEVIDKHLPPFPDRTEKWKDQDPRFAPDDFEGSHFDWHRKQLETFSIEIQRPELFEAKYGDR